MRTDDANGAKDASRVFEKLTRLSLDDVECMSNAFGVIVAEDTDAVKAIACLEFATDIAKSVTDTAANHTSNGNEQAFVMLKVALSLLYCVLDELEKHNDGDGYGYLTAARRIVGDAGSAAEM